MASTGGEQAPVEQVLNMAKDGSEPFSVTVGQRPQAMAYDGESIWVAHGDGSITKITVAALMARKLASTAVQIGEGG